jgi:hypothetical protein
MAAAYFEQHIRSVHVCHVTAGAFHLPSECHDLSAGVGFLTMQSEHVVAARELGRWVPVRCP